MAQQQIITKPYVGELQDNDSLFINHDGALRQIKKSDADFASGADMRAEVAAREAFEAQEVAAREAFEKSETEARGQFEISVKGQIAEKANVDGYYEEMTVGDAEQLVATQFVEDNEPYLFRSTGGSSDVGNRAYLDKIVGGTVAWNQMTEELNATNWIAESGATISFEDDVIVVSSTKTNNGAISVTHPTFKNGHKYLVTSKVKTETDLDYVVVGAAQHSGVTKETSIQAGQWVDNSYVAQSVVDGTVPLYCYARRIQYSNLRVKDFMIFDLTQMFGSTIADYIYSLEQATAGAGVAWFKKLFPNDYYAYNAGELLSVEGLQSHDAVGFNQWDKNNPSPVVHGYFDGVSMSIVGAPNHSIYYIPCLPNTEYCASRKAISTNDRFGIADMDDVPEVGGTINGYSEAPRSQVVGNNMVLTLTTGANAKYLAIWAHWVNETDGTEALDTLCINLSNPARNGEYEPYEKHSYPLDSSLTLRGIPKLDASKNLYYDGDEYTSDGKVKRKYGVVDLGSLDWTVYEDDSGILFSVMNAKIEPVPNTTHPNYIENILTSLLNTANYNGLITGNVKEGIAMYTSDGITYLRLRSSKYTTLDQLKAAMSGVMLVYELATPTTETATPYQFTQIIDDFGTEEFVSNGFIPAGHVTRYPANLRDKLQHLPDLASVDGTYLIQQSDKQMSLVYMPAVFPETPTEDGTYMLKTVVTGGVATLQWVAE